MNRRGRGNQPGEKMGCNTTACADCTRKCLLVHRKKTSSSPFIASFFKVMMGDQFSKVLFLPPEFARTVSALIGRRTLLEDFSGQHWEVTVSNLNGSFAFQQGWNAFSLHHKLEIGDLLVFDYLVGSHFIVRIYNKTACEKIYFSENRNQRKRGRPTGKSTVTVKDGQYQIADKDSMNEQGSSTSVTSVSDVEISQSQCQVNNLKKLMIVPTVNHEDCDGRPQDVPKVKCLEELYYMFDRGLVDEAREDRCPILDLSYFEMSENNCNTDTSKKITVEDERYPHHANTSVISQMEDLLVDKDPVDEEVAKIVVPCDESALPQIEELLVNKDPVDEEVAKRVVPCDASDFEMLEENNAFPTMDKIVTASEKISCSSNILEHLLFTTAVESEKNGVASSNSSNGVLKLCHIAEEKGKAQSKSEPEINQLMLFPKESTSLSDGIPTAQLKLNGKYGKSNVPVAIGTPNCRLGGNMNMVEEETLGVAPELCTDEETIKDIYGKLLQVLKECCGKSSDVRLREIAIPPMKIETPDIVPISSPIAASISCVIASSSQPFLELPTCLPLATSSNQRNKNGSEVVVLRDPDMRMWPVLYHEKSGRKILASGWEAFCKANNVQTGDKCVFEVENGTQSICGVNILRK